jgi:hypothetical protein
MHEEAQMTDDVNEQSVQQVIYPSRNKIDRAAERPLLGLSIEALKGLAEASARYKIPDVDALFLCLDELEQAHQRDQKARDHIVEIMSKIRLGASAKLNPTHRVGDGPWILQPVSWYTSARKAARTLGADIKRGRGIKHHLYVVLLGGFGDGENEFGLYVGETYRKPPKRLAQHLKGGRLASKKVTKRGICLLPSLYAHLNPLPRDTAKALEPILAKSFVAAGVPERYVKGGR